MSERRRKDALMASRMKKDKVERKTARCPLCHHQVSLKVLGNHIMTCRS